MFSTKKAVLTGEKVEEISDKISRLEQSIESQIEDMKKAYNKGDSHMTVFVLALNSLAPALSFILRDNHFEDDEKNISPHLYNLSRTISGVSNPKGITRRGQGSGGPIDVWDVGEELPDGGFKFYFRYQVK